MPRTQIEFDQANDGEFASQVELNGVKEDDNPGAFVQASMNNYDLWLRINNAGSRANDGNWIFFDPSGKTYVEYGGSGYTDVAYYIFRGTAVWTPTSFKSICSRSGTSANASNIRIYDMTNAQVICTLTYTADTIAIQTTTSLANLPAAEAMFVMQANSLGNVKTRIHAAALYPTT